MLSEVNNMTYSKPRPVTVADTVVALCEYDAQRTSLILSNVATETKYVSSLRDVAISGDNQGTPLYANDRLVYDFQSGSDPRLARYALGTATGGAVIVEEEFSNLNDPVLLELKKITKALQRICEKVK